MAFPSTHLGYLTAEEWWDQISLAHALGAIYLRHHSQGKLCCAVQVSPTAHQL